MKRLAIFVVLLNLFILCACSKNTSDIVTTNIQSDLENSIGLTEEDGLKYILVTDYEGKKNISIAFCEPIKKINFLTTLINPDYPF